MRPSLHDLEQQRRDLVSAIHELGDSRPGAVAGIIRRCGKPTCHCARPGNFGDGPSLRLTYKVQGKTISEALPTPAAVRKAEAERHGGRRDAGARVDAPRWSGDPRTFAV